MGSNVNPRLLLIEDDLLLAELVTTFLSSHRFTLFHADSIETAIETFAEISVDLIICDVMLPGQNGFCGYPTISQTFKAPIMFMTALTNTEDEIYALELGAVDYIHKPLMPNLLLARINNRLNIKSVAQKQVWKQGSLQLHRTQQQLLFGELCFDLTTQETELLWLLLRSVNEVLSREYLFEQIVGREYDGLDRAMDLKISRLRRKLEQLNIPGLCIRTVHGRGYMVNFEGDKL